ncbi:MAG: YdcF family protein [Sciscionella sp.]
MAGYRWGRLLGRTVAAVLLLVFVLLGGTAVRVWQVARQDDRSHADVILVLGTAQANGVPRPILRARLDHARTLFAQGVAPYVMTVGGKKPGDNYTEAESGVSYLAAHGVPANRLVEVNSGDDTLHSLQAAVAAFRQRGLHSAVLVSDPWHEQRCRAMATDLGIDAWTSPTRSGPIMGSRQVELRYIIRETGALLYYRITRSGAEQFGA